MLSRAKTVTEIAVKKLPVIIIDSIVFVAITLFFNILLYYFYFIPKFSDNDVSFSTPEFALREMTPFERFFALEFVLLLGSYIIASFVILYLLVKFHRVKKEYIITSISIGLLSFFFIIVVYFVLSTLQANTSFDLQQERSVIRTVAVDLATWFYNYRDWYSVVSMLLPPFVLVTMAFIVNFCNRKILTHSVAN